MGTYLITTILGVPYLTMPEIILLTQVKSSQLLTLSNNISVFYKGVCYIYLANHAFLLHATRYCFITIPSLYFKNLIGIAWEVLHSNPYKLILLLSEGKLYGDIFNWYTGKCYPKISKFASI